MHTRLLSFLSDIERALAADDPAPEDGAWETSRTVNYHQGLARLTIQVRTGLGLKARGSVFLQGYQLADGTPCLKAALSWAGTETGAVHAIFSRPDLDWTREARKVAAEWMAGPPVDATVSPVAASPELVAVG